MDEIATFGKLIVQRREHLRLSQMDIAELTGISDRTIRAIEKGKTSVALKNWIMVAESVGLQLQLGLKNKSDDTRKSL